MIQKKLVHTNVFFFFWYHSKYKRLCAQNKSMGQDRSQVRKQIATKQEPKISSSNDSEHGLCLIIYSNVAFSRPLVSGLSPILWGNPNVVNLTKNWALDYFTRLWKDQILHRNSFKSFVTIFFWVGKAWNTSLQWISISNLSFSHRLWRELISLNTLLPVHGAKLPLMIKLVKVFEKIYFWNLFC